MRRAGHLALALAASTALTFPALAQELPRYNQVDGNGVDLVTGEFFFSMTEGSIGSGEGTLALVRNWAGSAAWTDNWSGILYSRTIGGTTQIVVEFGTYSDTFTVSGGTYTSTKADGATLADLGGGAFRYTAADGTRIDFSSLSAAGYAIQGSACTRSPGGSCGIPSAITRPNGMTYTLSWDVEERCFQYDSELNCISSGAYPRFRGVSNSANYAFTLGYATDAPGTGIPVSNWFLRTGATFTNLDTAPGTLPSVAYSGGAAPTSVTDIGGQTWTFSYTAGALTGIRRPGATADTTTINYSGGGVSSVTNEGITTGYSRFTSGSGSLLTITDAANAETLVSINLDKQRVTQVFDPLERDTNYGHDSNGRLTGVQQPEGNAIAYTYDARGNVTETRAIAKFGSGLDDMVTTASYSTSCANPVTCNQPNSITDARGNVTELTYDSTHGGLLTVTAPAPGGTGDRPQTRYSYTQVTAVTGQPVTMLTGVSACQSGTASSCVGTANEARTVTAYDTDNLRVTSVTARNGDNSISLTSGFGYDPLGNLLTVDGPLTGGADTARFRYDAARRVVGTVAPDPDGTGNLKHRAERRTWTNGLPTRVETGTVNSQSDADWANFAAAETVETDYDANARPTVSRLLSGTTTHSLTQTTYDSLGRVQCVAQRMNPAEFATSSLPSDACTLDTEGTGANAFGPDRIARTYYDEVGQVTQVRTAYGVSGQEANEATTTYTANGLAETVTDAEGNKTTYEYDGHDRLRNLRYPSPTADGVSAPTSGIGADFEQITYLTASVGGQTRSTPLVASRLTRAGQTISFAYDNLGRLTEFNRPTAERSQSFEYDLLGRMTAADQINASIDYDWDALGRLESHADGGYGTTSFQYDAAGRRSRMTWTDGFYVTYDYLANGAVSAIRENGATSGAGVLATYAYDDLGRRASITRGNGATTTYGYDAVSRLSQLVQNPNGTGHDLTLDYGYNPAGQIVSTTRSNDAYAWGGHYQVNRGYSADGLNRYTASGSVTPTYDANGNLTSAGGAAYYVYDSTNRLYAMDNGVLGYDPAGRLFAIGTTAGHTYLLNSGDEMIGEYSSSGAVLRRYVHGPGIDEPLVWYEGSGTSDRRWLHADERGSVIALSNGSGSVTNVNAYDEYGIPAAGNVGRFQYTGQQWIDELGMQYSRNRIYSPTLGRFMQTDPIGFGGGMNLYGYVLNDPVNFTDPLGLTQQAICTGSRIVSSCQGQNGGMSRTASGFSVFGPSGGYFRRVGPNTPGISGPNNSTTVTSSFIWIPGLPYAWLFAAQFDTHDYIWGSRICVAATTDCSESRIIRKINSPICNIPGQRGTEPIDPNQPYSVWLEIGPISVFGGRVFSRVSAGGLSVTNTTTPIHPFRGIVTRNYSRGYQTGDWYVTTRGQGDSAVPGMDWVNQDLGRGIFDDVDQQCAAHISSGDQ